MSTITQTQLVEDALRAVPFLLEGDPHAQQFVPVPGLDDPRIADEHVQAALLGQPRRPHTALLSTKDHKLRHRSLRVTMDRTASMMPTIQKRDTILLSWMPFFWKWW